MTTLRRFKPYPAYKDSGVEGLGEIPAHWKVRRLKFAAHIEAGQSPSSDSVAAGADGLPFLQGNAEFGPRYPLPHLVCSEASKRAKVSDLLLSVRAPVGALNIADQPYGIGRGLCAITPGDDFEPQFCYYVLWAVRFRLDAVSTGSTYEAVTASEVGDLPALLPSRHEQRAIAAFLDREMAKIDALLAKKGRLVELLQEKRIALITQAVTRGFEPNVPMKDSGVEWLGEIPAHWAVRRFKTATRRVDVGIAEAATHAYADEGVPILRATNVRANRIVGEDVLRIQPWFAEKNRSKYLLTGDLVTVRTGVPGTTAVVPSDFNRSQCFTMLISTPAKDQVSEFLSYFLNSGSARNYFEVEGWGTAQTNISVPILQRIPTPVPPEPEQRAIVEYIRSHVARIDGLSANIEAGIDRLKEFRAALISAAVTGRIDVREGTA